MNISDIANTMWSESREIPFGNRREWAGNSFLKTWISNNSFDYDELNAPGWYWFISDMKYQEIRKTSRPASLPNAGCDFGATSRENLELLGEAHLCAPNGGKIVLYNGHEKKSVKSRIRAHFALSNNKTGALGIRHYPLSERFWSVKYFTSHMVSQLPENMQNIATRLADSKTGRSIVESAWRTNHQWPVFCKQ